MKIITPNTKRLLIGIWKRRGKHNRESIMSRILSGIVVIAGMLAQGIEI